MLNLIDHRQTVIQRKILWIDLLLRRIISSIV